MANYAPKVAKLLGIELREEFGLKEKEGRYSITEKGVECSGQQYKTWHMSHVSIGSILTGEYTIKRKWKPQNGELYYFPDIGVSSLSRSIRWLGTEDDKNLYGRGFVFQTEEEAVAMAKKILVTVWKEQKNE